jgi:stage III sporulation protein AA
MQTEAVWRALPRKIREVLAEKDLHDLQEIRLRSGQPLLLKRENRLFSLGKEGTFLPAADEKGMRISMADLRETVSLLSGYSLYAFEEELRQGYLTIEGGHRVGFCGKAVLENGEIRTLRQINALNIRIARERKGWKRFCRFCWKRIRFAIPCLFHRRDAEKQRFCAISSVV